MSEKQEWLKVDLEKPTSVADAFDVLSCIGANSLRGQAAAIGITARGQSRPAARLKDQSTQGWLDYGGQIVDFYAQHGIALQDWLKIASKALDLVAEVAGGISKTEVNKAQKN